MGRSDTLEADHGTHQTWERRPVWVLMTPFLWLLIPDKHVFTVTSLLFTVSQKSVFPTVP